MNANYWYKKSFELLDEIDNTKTGKNMLAIWFFGQESLVVKQQDTIVYLDPFLTDLLDSQGMSMRLFKPPFSPDEVNHADWIFCSHNHIDHLDPETLKGIYKSSSHSKIIVPAPHTEMLKCMGLDESRIIGAKQRIKLQLDEGIFALPVAAAHEEYQTDENGNYLNLGYMLDFNGIRIFHAGDMVETEDTALVLESLKLDVLCLPINGADWLRRRKNIIGNMNARTAANLAAESKADIVLPMHHDLFAENSENPAHFVDYMHRLYPDKKYHVMKPGERFIYMK